MAAQQSKLMYARYTTSSGQQNHSWQDYKIGRPATRVTASEPGEDATGTFAHVFAHRGKIDAAYFFTPETQRSGETTSWYCYLNGRLARMRTQFTLLPSTVTWVRIKYYGEDGAYLTQTDTHHSAIASDEGAAIAPPLDEHVFATPSALPFYKLFRAHQHR